MTTLTKNQKTFSLSFHSIERLEERFQLSIEKIQDSFQRSKMLNTQNSVKYGKTYVKRVFEKSIHEPNQKLLVNPYYDMTFVIDQHTNTIITIYSYSKGNEIK